MPIDVNYLRASDGTGVAVRAVVTGTRAPAATTLTVDSVSNLPSKLIGTSGVYNTTTKMLDTATIKVFFATVSGSNLEIVSMAPGYTDNGNEIGEVVVLKPATAWSDMLADFLTVGHDDAGNIDTTTGVFSGNVSVGGTFSAGNTTINGRSTNAVQTIASSATLTPNAADYNIVECTALAVNAAIAAPTGTPANKQSLEIVIKDNGTIRTLSWNAAYAAVGVTLPTATTAGKWMYVVCQYNSTASKWHVLSVGVEA